MGNYGISEIQKLVEDCQFDEFKNAVHAGEIDINIEHPKRYGLGGSIKSFSYRYAPDLENAVKWIKLFASLGADFNSEMMSLADNARGAELIKAFAETGVDIHRRDDAGRTILFFTAWHGNTEMIKRLAELGLDVNAKDNDGCTPLHYTLEIDKTDNMRCLVELGADVNARDNNGCSAVFRAISDYKIDSLKCLKSLGADLNAKTNDGSTPLSLARNSPKAAKWLKANGAT